MKVKLKILERVSLNFFMLYMLVFEVCLACSGAEFELFIYLDLFIFFPI